MKQIEPCSRSRHRDRTVLIAAAVLATALAPACGGRPGEPVPPAPPLADVETSLYLIGDAGAPDPAGEPVLRAVAADIGASTAGQRMLLFLGDNVYPRGFPEADDPDRPEAERRLSTLISVARETRTPAIFIPGNHDWNYGAGGEVDRILRAIRFGQGLAGDSVRFLPEDACPGPEVVDVSDRIRVIAIDTQWWLLENPFEGTPEACETRSAAGFVAALRDDLETANGRQVVVVGHHPLTSGGPHGGYFSLRQHIFPLTEVWDWAWIPLPVLGSIYPLARRSGISDQDMSGSRYRAMREAIEDVFAANQPLLYAGGHDHSLQVSTATEARYHVVSGAGIYHHESPVHAGTGTLFAESEAGYMRLDFGAGGGVRLAVVTVDGSGTGTEAFALRLDTSRAVTGSGPQP